MIDACYESSQTEYNRMIDTLTSFSERIILDDGRLNEKERDDNRFYRNDIWDKSLFIDISQFQSSIKNLQCQQNAPIQFCFSVPNLNIEAKYIFYNKIFDGEWSISNLLVNQNSYLHRTRIFLEEHYPLIQSFSDLVIDEVTETWCKWLEAKGTTVITKDKWRAEALPKNYPHKTYIALYLPTLCKWLKSFWTFGRNGIKRAGMLES